jgi:hypothetical protein
MASRKLFRTAQFCIPLHRMLGAPHLLPRVFPQLITVRKFVALIFRNRNRATPELLFIRAALAARSVSLIASFDSLM